MVGTTPEVLSPLLQWPRLLELALLASDPQSFTEDCPPQTPRDECNALEDPRGRETLAGTGFTFTFHYVAAVWPGVSPKNPPVSTKSCHFFHPFILIDKPNHLYRG